MPLICLQTSHWFSYAPLGHPSERYGAKNTEQQRLQGIGKLDCNYFTKEAKVSIHQRKYKLTTTYFHCRAKLKHYSKKI